MEMQREKLIEIAAAAGPVLVLLAVLAWIGTAFVEGPDNGLSVTGGQAMVAAIVVFVLVMTGIGILLARSDYDE
jgi:uncharacterized membrane protein (DUF485 family)